MRVREIDPGNRRERRRFIDLSFHVHRDLPQWVPPVLVNQHAELDPRRNPFFEHSEASVLVAERARRVVGRMVVMDHRPYNGHTGFSDALFGLFECEDDPEAAAALFAEAAGWARRRGLRGLSGPRRFLSGTPAGILVEGFEHAPALAMPYNPPYYERLLRHAGLTKESDLLSGYIDEDAELPPSFFAAADAVVDAHGFSPFFYGSRRRLWRERMTLADLYNRAFSEFPDFCPMSPAEMRLMARGLAVIADPDLLFSIRRGEETAAFVVMVPDVSGAVRRSRGRVFPAGWLRMLRAARRTVTADMQVGGVLPEFRGTGANLVTYTTVHRLLRTTRYRRMELVQIGEENTKLLSSLEQLGQVTWAKRHRLYRREL